MGLWKRPQTERKREVGVRRDLAYTWRKRVGSKGGFSTQNATESRRVNKGCDAGARRCATFTHPLRHRRRVRVILRRGLVAASLFAAFFHPLNLRFGLSCSLRLLRGFFKRCSSGLFFINPGFCSSCRSSARVRSRPRLVLVLELSQAVFSLLWSYVAGLQFFFRVYCCLALWTRHTMSSELLFAGCVRACPFSQEDGKTTPLLTLVKPR